VKPASTGLEAGLKQMYEATAAALPESKPRDVRQGHGLGATAAGLAGIPESSLYHQL
jgi:hypothetical protein